MRVKALILAAGLGTRLRPLSDSIAKCLAPIHGRPLLDFWLEDLMAAGASEIRVNTHGCAATVHAYLQQVRAAGVPVDAAFEPQLLGSLGTLRRHQHWALDADLVVVVYADNYSETDLAALLDFHRRHPHPATVALFQAPNPRACGIAQLDGDGTVVDFVEKPAQPRSPWANAGLYVLEPMAVRTLCAAPGNDLARDGLPTLCGRMVGFTATGWQRDIGTWAGYHDAQGRQPRPIHSSRLPALRPAVFLDRDGTLIRNIPYLADPARVALLGGVTAALRQLREAGFVRVVVSNQSGVGRGLVSEECLGRVHEQMRRLLRQDGADVDAIYTSFHVPHSRDRHIVEHFDRKPGPGMLLRAAAELRLDLQRSWVVGDCVSDVLAGRAAGCRGGFWVGTRDTSELHDPTLRPARDLADATQHIIGGPRRHPRRPAAPPTTQTAAERLL